MKAAMTARRHTGPGKLVAAVGKGSLALALAISLLGVQRPAAQAESKPLAPGAARAQGLQAAMAAGQGGAVQGFAGAPQAGGASSSSSGASEDAAAASDGGGASGADVPRDADADDRATAASAGASGDGPSAWGAPSPEGIDAAARQDGTDDGQPADSGKPWLAGAPTAYSRQGSLSWPSQTFYLKPNEAFPRPYARITAGVSNALWTFEPGGSRPVLPEGLQIGFSNQGIAGAAKAIYFFGAVAPSCPFGIYPAYVRAESHFGRNYWDATYTFVIGDAPAIAGDQPTELPVADAIAGGFYGYQIESNSAALSADPQTRWSLSSGTLPEGLSLNDKTGEITGAPQPGSGGDYAFTVQLATGYGTTSHDFTLKVKENPVITTTALAPAPVGVAYSQRLEANPAALFWEATGLPASLTLDAQTGEISGVPRAGDAGSHQVSVKCRGAHGCSAPVTLSLAVGEVPAVESTSLEHLSAGQHGSRRLTASGAPGSWACADEGDLPAGLAFNSDGTLFGTPAAGTGGRYSIEVSASNEFGASGPAEVAFEVYEAPRLATPVLVPAHKGEAFKASLETARCWPDPAWSISSGALPEGMTLDAATGVLSGAPRVSGSFEAAVVCENAEGASSAPLELVVDDPPVITTERLGSAETGRPYSVQLEATGYPGAFAWSVADGALPQGLSLDAQTGVVSGVPAGALGSYRVTIACSNGVRPDARRAYDVVVGMPAAIEDGPLPEARAGEPYSAQLEASGSPASFSWALAPGSSLPEGLALDRLSGVIAGTPPVPGRYGFDVVCDNGVGEPATRSLTIDVSAPPVISTDVVPAIQAGEAMSVQLETDPCWPEPTWSLAAGSELPAGIELTDAGKLVGATDGFGPFYFTAVCGNGVDKPDTRDFVLEVERHALADEAALPTGQVGSPYAATLKATGWPEAFLWDVEQPGGAPAFAPEAEAPASFGAAAPVSFADGLDLDPATGQVSGTPLVAGDFEVRLAVTNGVGLPDVRTATLHVDPAPAAPAPASPGSTTGETRVPGPSRLAPTGDTLPYIPLAAFCASALALAVAGCGRRRCGEGRRNS